VTNHDASVVTNPEPSTAGRPSVEDAIARALSDAASAGRWDVVAALARELEARRVASAGNIVKLESGNRRG